MSLETPERIRSLQKKLYCKAKSEPDFRFYLLYDKVYREDILEHAYKVARANAGAPGVDGVSFAQIDVAGSKEWLAGIGKQLREKTYRPDPVRRVMIPKPNGGERPLGIPTIRDRVVQTAVKLVIEPIFEADLEPNAYGYRPKRSAGDAVRAVHGLLRDGYTDVRHKMGTPQGGVISPLLANLYMNRFLKHWRLTEQGRKLKAHVIAYADDFVILSRGYAQEAKAWAREVMSRLGLSLNEAKTSVRNARMERFDFLGYSFGPHYAPKNGQRYLGASPSKKSVARLKPRISAILHRGNKDPWEEVCGKLNRLLKGWSGYFEHGTLTPAYRAVDNHVMTRAQRFLVQRHKVPSRGTVRFSRRIVFGELGVLSLRVRQAARRPTWVLQ